MTTGMAKAGVQTLRKLYKEAVDTHTDAVARYRNAWAAADAAEPPNPAVWDGRAAEFAATMATYHEQGRTCPDKVQAAWSRYFKEADALSGKLWEAAESEGERAVVSEFNRLAVDGLILVGLDPSSGLFPTGSRDRLLDYPAAANEFFPMADQLLEAIT